MSEARGKGAGWVQQRHDQVDTGWSEARLARVTSREESVLNESSFGEFRGWCKKQLRVSDGFTEPDHQSLRPQYGATVACRPCLRKESPGYLSP